MLNYLKGLNNSLVDCILNACFLFCILGRIQKKAYILSVMNFSDNLKEDMSIKTSLSFPKTTMIP